MNWAEFSTGARVIIEGQLLLPEGHDSVRMSHGQVLVTGQRITRVVEFGRGDAPLGSPDLGSPECLISPGFIDTHLHIPQFDCLGVDGLTLLDWLRRAVFPTEAAWADADHAGQVSGRVARRLLSAGTTGIAAYATVHHGATREAMRALGTAGLRGYVGQVLMDQEAPAELIRPAGRLLEEAGLFTPGEFGRIDPIISPRFAVSCSRELLDGAGRLAKQTGWAIQTHLAEMIPEVDLVERLHGAGYVEVYRRAGLLNTRTILGHGIWLDGAELDVLREAQSTIAHCPTANLFLQAGRFDRNRVRQTGVGVSLGSDIAGGPDVCMVRVARAMIETGKAGAIAQQQANRSGDMVLGPVANVATAWWHITRGNAASLGWLDAGVLSAGAPADVLVIDPSRGTGAQPDWCRAIDPLGLVMYAWDERWIAHTIVNGSLHSW